MHRSESLPTSVDRRKSWTDPIGRNCWSCFPLNVDPSGVVNLPQHDTNESPPDERNWNDVNDVNKLKKQNKAKRNEQIKSNKKQ